MKRNIDSTINETRRGRGKYDLYYSECMELCDRANRNMVDGIYDAFRFGFTLGARYEKARRRDAKR